MSHFFSIRKPIANMEMWLLLKCMRRVNRNTIQNHTPAEKKALLWIHRMVKNQQRIRVSLNGFCSSPSLSFLCVGLCVCVKLAFDMASNSIAVVFITRKKTRYKNKTKHTFLLASMQFILTHFLYASRIGSLLYVSISLLLKLGQRCAMLRIWSSLLTKCTFIAAELCHKSCCCICNQAEKLVHLALPLYRTNNQSKTAYCIRMQCTKPTTF